jgi:Ca-activated chloride channel family protein
VNEPEYGWTLAQPGWLWLAPALLLAAVRRWRALPRARFAAQALLAEPEAPGLPRLPATWRARTWWLPGACQAAALACVLVAMSAPVERVPAPPSPPARDVLLCLDVSSSMAATDLAPDRTRLQVGVEVAARFVRARAQDRVGFVAFARYADLRCPLTRDHDAVAELLQSLQLVANQGPEDATAIGAAVARAAATLRRSPVPGRVIVVVTDGEENVATAQAPDEIAPLHAAQLCAQAGIRVHAIVVGRGNQKADGSLQALDTTAVQQLAATTGGRFFIAGDATALAAVYAAIDALEAVPVAPPGVRTIARFPVALGLALAWWLLARSLQVLSWWRVP